MAQEIEQRIKAASQKGVEAMMADVKHTRAHITRDNVAHYAEVAAAHAIREFIGPETHAEPEPAESETE